MKCHTTSTNNTDATWQSGISSQKCSSCKQLDRVARPTWLKILLSQDDEDAGLANREEMVGVLWHSWESLFCHFCSYMGFGIVKSERVGKLSRFRSAGRCRGTTLEIHSGQW